MPEVLRIAARMSAAERHTAFNGNVARAARRSSDGADGNATYLEPPIKAARFPLPRLRGCGKRRRSVVPIFLCAFP